MTFGKKLNTFSFWLSSNLSKQKSLTAEIIHQELTWRIQKFVMGLAQILHEEFNIFSTQTHSFCKTHPYCVWGMTDVKRNKLYTYIGNLNDQKPDSTSITTRQEVLPHQTFLWERGAWSWEITKSLHLSRAYRYLLEK